MGVGDPLIPLHCPLMALKFRRSRESFTMNRLVAESIVKDTESTSGTKYRGVLAVPGSGWASAAEDKKATDPRLESLAATVLTKNVDLRLNQ